MTSRVLLTGATGLIGRQMATPLKAAGHHVIALSRGGAVDDADEVITADLLDDSDRRAALRAARASHLVHLAWHDAAAGRMQAPENLDWAAATIELVREFAGLGGKHVVAAGSCAEYDWSYETLAETTPLKPGSLYGQAKAQTGLLLAGAAGALDLRLVWARIFFCYGPGEPRGRLLGDLIHGLNAGLPVDCTDGRQERDYLHTADIAAALVALLGSDLSGAVNVGSGQALEVRELILTLAELAGRADLIRLGALPRPEMDPSRLVADIGRLASAGFAPAFDLKRGLRDCLRRNGLAEA